jgi:uncharacterized phage protein gp47/JayE
MSFARPTLLELIARTTDDLVSRLSLISPLLRRAFTRVLAKVWSGAVHELHGHLDWNARQLFAVSADDTELDKHGRDYGIPRLAAAFAAGGVTFTGTNGTAIPAGTRWQRSDGLLFDTQALATIALGTATATIKAVAYGDSSNTEVGVVLTLVSPIAGLSSSATVSGGGITGGADPETNENYRERILERKRNTPQGGAKNDYIAWAKEVAGVTRVWVFPQWDGPGTVGVAFVLDGEVDIIPDGGKVAEVQAYIDDPGRRPVTATVITFAPTPLAVDFTIAVLPNTTAVKDAVTAQLVDFLRREGEPGVTLKLSNLDEAISIATGETSHVMTAPAADVVASSSQIPVMGTITWA